MMRWAGHWTAVKFLQVLVGKKLIERENLEDLGIDRE
jgi:hypothetical protein